MGSKPEQAEKRINRKPLTIKRRWLLHIVYLVALLIPLAILFHVRPWILSLGCAGSALVSLLVSVYVSGRFRTRLQNASKTLLCVALVLGIIHLAHALDPVFERKGYMFLSPPTVAFFPRQAEPGDTVTYTLEGVNDGDRIALGRTFRVNGTLYTGVLVYFVLLQYGGSYFPVTGAPAGSHSNSDAIGTVVYANPENIALEPLYWEWSTVYTPGWSVIGYITSDGTTQQNLDPGERIQLQFQVRIPPEHPGGRVPQKVACLCYRDPAWATWKPQLIWNSLGDVLEVLPPSEPNGEKGD
jgi:hypothetical protein